VRERERDDGRERAWVGGREGVSGRKSERAIERQRRDFLHVLALLVLALLAPALLAPALLVLALLAPALLAPALLAPALLAPSILMSHLHRHRVTVENIAQ
jgi:hypothetical protein